MRFKEVDRGTDAKKTYDIPDSGRVVEPFLRRKCAMSRTLVGRLSAPILVRHKAQMVVVLGYEMTGDAKFHTVGANSLSFAK